MICSDAHESVLDPAPLPLRIERAWDWWPRLRGLLGRDDLAADQALWIKPCCVVHTFGMRFAVAVHFLDHKGHILRSYAQVRPNEIRFCWLASSAVEMLAANNASDLERQQQQLREIMA